MDGASSSAPPLPTPNVHVSVNSDSEASKSRLAYKGGRYKRYILNTPPLLLSEVVDVPETPRSTVAVPEFSSSLVIPIEDAHQRPRVSLRSLLDVNGGFGAARSTTSTPIPDPVEDNSATPTGNRTAAKEVAFTTPLTSAPAYVDKGKGRATSPLLGVSSGVAPELPPIRAPNFYAETPTTRTENERIKIAFKEAFRDKAVSGVLPELRTIALAWAQEGKVKKKIPDPAAVNVRTREDGVKMYSLSPYSLNLIHPNIQRAESLMNTLLHLLGRPTGWKFFKRDLGVIVTKDFLTREYSQRESMAALIAVIKERSLEVHARFVKHANAFDDKVNPPPSLPDSHGTQADRVIRANVIHSAPSLASALGRTPKSPLPSPSDFTSVDPSEADLEEAEGASGASEDEDEEDPCPTRPQRGLEPSPRIGLRRT